MFIKIIKLSLLLIGMSLFSFNLVNGLDSGDNYTKKTPEENLEEVKNSGKKILLKFSDFIKDLNSKETSELLKNNKFMNEKIKVDIISYFTNKDKIKNFKSTIENVTKISNNKYKIDIRYSLDFIIGNNDAEINNRNMNAYFIIKKTNNTYKIIKTNFIEKVKEGVQTELYYAILLTVLLVIIVLTMIFYISV